MSRLDLIKGALALESLDELAAEPAPVAIVSDAEINEELAETAVDSVKTMDEVEKTTDAISDLQGVGATLEALQDMMQASIRSGGMQPQTAQAIDMTINVALKPLGLESLIAMPAVEAYGTTADRLETTQVSIERIGEMAKRVWEAIKALFAKLGEAMKKFFAVEDRKLAIFERWADSIAKKTKEQTQRTGTYALPASLRNPESTSAEESSTKMISGFTAGIKALSDTKRYVDKMHDVLTKAITQFDDKVSALSDDAGQNQYTALAMETGEILESVKKDIGEESAGPFIGVDKLTIDWQGVGRNVVTGSVDVDYLSGDATKTLADKVRDVVKAVRVARKDLEKQYDKYESDTTKQAKKIESSWGKLDIPQGITSNLTTMLTWHKHIQFAREVQSLLTESCYQALKFCRASQGETTKKEDVPA